MRMLRFSSIVLFVALSACGGGGSHTVPAPAASSATPMSASSAAHFTITVPAQSATSTARRPAYISANTQSAIVTLTTVNGAPFTGASAITAANLNVSNPACSGVPLTCTVSVPAAPGTDVFTVSLYDAVQTSTSPATPLGNLLSTASVSVTVVAGQNSAPATPLVLAGVPTAVTATFATDSLTAGHVGGSSAAGFTIVGNQPYTLTIAVKDASGATIVGSGAPTLSSSSSAVTLTNTSGSNYTVQVTKYSATPVSITATTPSGTPPSFTIATIPELWLADVNNNQVVAYALFPNCSPVACSQVTTDSLTGFGSPWGLAFDGNGNLWVSDRIGPNIAEFKPGSGPSLSPLATITNSLRNPLGIAFDPNGKLWVADGGNLVVYQFPATNGAAPLQPITSSFNGPTGVAFDPSGTLWVSDVFNQNVTGYSTSNGAYNNVTVQTGVGNAPFLAFDAPGNLWLAANASTVKEYTAPLTSSSTAAASFNSGVFTSGLAFDPSGNIFVGNRASRTVSAYVPGNGATAFETINVTGQPQGIAITP